MFHAIISNTISSFINDYYYYYLQMIYKTTINDILNFNINKLDDLDELDEDSDDNTSRKECITNISNIKSNTKKDLINKIESNEILDIIIHIKNNSKKLDEFTIEMIKNYVELLILILEQIKKLF